MNYVANYVIKFYHEDYVANYVIKFEKFYHGDYVANYVIKFAIILSRKLRELRGKLRYKI